MPRTKIICTIGPASREPDVLRRLVAEGMSVARLNLAHGSLDEHAENVERIRAVAEEADRTVAVQVDLQGPKLRVGEMEAPGVMLQEGADVTFTTEDVLGRTPEAIPVQNEAFPRLVKPGDRILLADGTIEVQVVTSEGHQLQGQVLVGGELKSNKGINLPGVSTELPSLTDKDRRDLASALEWDVDWIALSFVRTADDVQELKALIRDASNGSDTPTPVMAKIEKPQALENMDEIIRVSDAVMVARGDLGIEIPPEEVPMAQKRIIEVCNQAGLPVVTATQMLDSALVIVSASYALSPRPEGGFSGQISPETPPRRGLGARRNRQVAETMTVALDSMIRHPRPTRAEASDVANAILDGTDAIMLSGETSIGAYPVVALQTMIRIAEEVESQRPDVPTRPFQSTADSVERSIAATVSRAARDAAHNLGAAAIITPTASGYTAQLMSRYRSHSPIIAITPDRPAGAKAAGAVLGRDAPAGPAYRQH